MKSEKVVNTIKQNVLLIIAVVLMLVPVFIAMTFLMPAEKFLLFETKAATYALQPDFLAGWPAIAIYSAVVIRGDMSTFKSPVKVLLAILNITFIASFSKTFLNNTEWKLFGLVKLGISSQTFAILCVAFSWLGMKSLAGFSWVILFVASISTLTKINNELGFLGYLYILCAFLSIGMQIAGGYISIDTEQLKSDFFSTSGIIKSDVNKSIETTKGAVNSAIGVAKMAAGIPNIPNMQNEAKQIVDNE